MKSAKNEFEKRLYFWALRDWEREIKQGFPFLTKVGEYLALKLMGSMEFAEQMKFAKALVKRGVSPKTMAELDIGLTDEDKYYHKLYLSAVDRLMLDSAFSDKLRKAITSRLKKRTLKKHVVSSLSHVLGSDYEDLGDWEEWRYCTKIGPWQLITYIDIGGSYHKLCYHHSIMFHSNLILVESISLFRWLGISGGETNWSGFANSDIETVAKSISEIVSHFLRAAPILLKDLLPEKIN